MSISSKPARFSAQHIPSFLALDPAQCAVELPAAEVAPLAQVSPGRKLVSDARIEVLSKQDGLLHFVLHSRMNARILIGSIALGADQDQSSLITGLLEQCTHESNFVLQPVEGGLQWHLLDEVGDILGRSDRVADEALARATLRLITGQAARALRTLGLNA